MQRKFDIQHVKHLLEEKGLQLTSTEYVNSKTKLIISVCAANQNLGLFKTFYLELATAKIVYQNLKAFIEI